MKTEQPMPTDVGMPTKKEARAGKYLVFRVGDEHYAIPLSEVREVIAMTTMTRLPAVNDALEGVFNLRGKILSVCDLRNRLGKGKADSKKPCVIAVDIDGYEIANIVDDVIEVIAFKVEQISSGLGDYSFDGVFKDYILGVARTARPGTTPSGGSSERLTVLLDIQRLLRLGAEDAGVPDRSAA